MQSRDSWTLGREKFAIDRHSENALTGVAYKVPPVPVLAETKSFQCEMRTFNAEYPSSKAAPISGPTVSFARQADVRPLWPKRFVAKNSQSH
jgi:hypothetical protein